VAQLLKLKVPKLEQTCAGSILALHVRQFLVRIDEEEQSSKVGAVSCVFETATSFECSALLRIGGRHMAS
jgi:hypothetical protein